MQLVKNHINILLPLLVISAISRVIPDVGFLYYLTPLLLVLFIISGYDQILKNKQLRILIIFLGSFGLWAALTSLWSDYPFVTLSRAAYFLLVAFGTSLGVVLWFKEQTSDKNLFGFLLPANILIVASSLISLLIGFPEDAWTGGNGMGFMGFTAHQNTLGMALLFTFSAPFYLLLKSMNEFNSESKNEITSPLRGFVMTKLNCHSEFTRRGGEQHDAAISKNSIPVSKENPSLRAKRKVVYPPSCWVDNLKKTTFIFYLLLLLSNILILLLSHSRAALLSLGVAILLSLFLFFNNRQKIYFAGGIVLIVVIIFTVPSLSTKFEKYTLKGTGHITANRDILWGPSYEAAKIGGFFGIGYGTSTKEIETQFQIVDDAGRLRREKGNGILALIEEVGIIGLLLFVIPIGYTFTVIARNPLPRDDVAISNEITSFVDKKFDSLVMTKEQIILFSFLIAFLLHSLFEAWMVGMGGFSLLIFLMFLGNAVTNKATF